MLMYFIFLLFGFVGLFTILANNPVHSILALVLVFFLSSCITITLGVEFLAILILIVYVGAISVLFLFVVMLLNIRVTELNISLLKYWWLGLLHSFFFFFNFVYSTNLYIFENINYSVVLNYINFSTQLENWDAVTQFGEIVFLYFPHLMLLASLILFVAIVSPVVLSYITFTDYTVSNSLGQRKQILFYQTLRDSVENV